MHFICFLSILAFTEAFNDNPAEYTEYIVRLGDPWQVTCITPYREPTQWWFNSALWYYNHYIYWKDKIVVVMDDRYIMKERTTPHAYILEVFQTDKDHAGLYQCLHKNGATEEGSQYYKLTLVDKSNIELLANENNTIKLVMSISYVGYYIIPPVFQCTFHNGDRIMNERKCTDDIYELFTCSLEIIYGPDDDPPLSCQISFESHNKIWNATKLSIVRNSFMSYAKEEEPYSVSCDTASTTSMSWYFNGVLPPTNESLLFASWTVQPQVHNRYNFTYSNESKTYSMMIAHVDGNHAGTYLCTHKSNRHLVAKKIELVVIEQSSIQFSGGNSTTLTMSTSYIGHNVPTPLFQCMSHNKLITLDNKECLVTKNGSTKCHVKQVYDLHSDIPDKCQIWFEYVSAKEVSSKDQSTVQSKTSSKTINIVVIIIVVIILIIIIFSITYFICKRKKKKLLQMDRSLFQMEERSSPMDQRSLKMEERSLPMDQRLSPMDQRLLQMEERLLKMEESSLPMDQRLLKMEEILLPMDQRLLPMDQRLLPMDQRLLPIDQRLLKMEESLLPTDQILLKMEESSLPMDQRLLKMEEILLPMDQRLLPMDQRLLPMDQRLLPMDQRLLPIDQRLLKMEESLLPTDQILLKMEESSLPMDQRLLPMDERLLKMEESLLQMEERLLQMDQRFLQMDERLLQMDQRLLPMDQRLLQMDENIRLDGEKRTRTIGIRSLNDVPIKRNDILKFISELKEDANIIEYIDEIVEGSHGLFTVTFYSHEGAISFRNKFISKYGTSSYKLTLHETWPVRHDDCRGMEIKLVGDGMEESDIRSCLEDEKYGGAKDSIKEVIFKDEKTVVVIFKDASDVDNVSRRLHEIDGIKCCATLFYGDLAWENMNQHYFIIFGNGTKISQWISIPLNQHLKSINNYDDEYDDDVDE